MSLCKDFIPSERIRVFISSAQSNENGFAWSDVRRRVKDCLSQCIYFNPFIIEDEASVTPSLQFFQRQVERADVIVLLVKGEVRNGTATEYALSKKLNKPLLVYFLEDESPDEKVQELKKDLQDSDRCTYHPVYDFDNIESIIRNDLMNNIVRTFQDRYYISEIDAHETVSTLLPEDKILSNASIPSKTELAKFGSCYNRLFELLHLDYFKQDIPESEAHTFGCQLIQSLILGHFSIDDGETEKFIIGCGEVFETIDWLQKRWEAINYYFSGEIEKALTSEEEALALAKAANESNWIINNILIDCRNLDNEKNKLDRVFNINGKFQEELSAQKHLSCLPILDRYLNNVYDKIEKDEFRVETASRHTELLGTSLSYTLTDWANYLFSAAVYGSYTHIQISKNLLAVLLSRYAKITDDAQLAFLALEQYILFGDSKNTKLYLDNTWDTIYSLVASHSGEIWALTNYAPISDRDAIKQTVFSAIGLYFSNEVFAEAENYLLEYSNSVYWGNSEAYFDAILSNLHRMDPGKVIVSLTSIIKNKNFHLGNKLSHIILYINLESIDESILKDFSIAIHEQLQYIIENNGDPQMIAALVARDTELFGDLTTVPNNGLTGIQKKLYKINMGSHNWLPILKDEIDSAKQQFAANSKNGVYYGFAENPYAMISRIIRNENDNKEIDRTIIYDFMPHVVEVLNSEAAIPTKESCVSCLCDVLSSFVDRDIAIPNSLIEALRTVDIQKGSTFFFSKSRKTLEIRVLMAKIIAEIDDIGNLLQICVDFGSLEVNEKIVVIDCIEKYLFQRRSKLNDINELIVSLVLQCTAEKDADIRSLAYRCVAFIIKSPYKNIAELTISKAIFDPANSVRSTILNICTNGYIPKDISDRLIELLRNDANYCLRKQANDIC